MLSASGALRTRRSTSPMLPHLISHSGLVLVLLLPSFQQAGSGLTSPSEARACFFGARIGALCSRAVCLVFCRGQDPAEDKEEEGEEEDEEAPCPAFVFFFSPSS